VAQVVECCPSKHEAPSSNPNTAKKEKKIIHWELMVCLSQPIYELRNKLRTPKYSSVSTLLEGVTDEKGCIQCHSEVG
jgi:hypothetical protein